MVKIRALNNPLSDNTARIIDKCAPDTTTLMQVGAPIRKRLPNCSLKEVVVRSVCGSIVMCKILVMLSVLPIVVMPNESIARD